MIFEETVNRVNPLLLAEELRAVPGYISFSLAENRLTIRFEQGTAREVVQPLIAALLAAHNPDGKSVLEQIQQTLDQKRSAAKTGAEKIPEWAAMTEAEAVNYIQANINDLASARSVLIAMSRLLVALRDAQWPELGENRDAINR